VKNQITHWKGKINTLHITRTNITDINTIKIPAITTQSVAHITPGIIFDVSNRMVVPEMRIKAKKSTDNTIPQSNIKLIKNFAENIAVQLAFPNQGNDSFYNISANKKNSLDKYENYAQIIASLEGIDGSPIWSVFKTGGIFGKDTITSQSSFKIDGTTGAWYIAFSDILARWAATCMHFNALKKTD
jgi:hypothetical protein